MAKATATILEVIELNYKLSELPSSQHKAGLAGLVLVVQHLAKKPGAIIDITQLTERGIVFKCNLEGLKHLFDEAYAASTELVWQGAPRKDQEAAKIEEIEELDQKTQKKKTKKRYYYPETVPRGSVLDLWDNTSKRYWIKLWRDMTWTIMRGVPAQRKPFNDRAEGKPTTDAELAWKQLQTSSESVDLPSTYFIGAQATNAEGVRFLDSAKNQFLLHFWTFAAQVFVPIQIDRDGKSTPEGFVIAVPDIQLLKAFCSEYVYMMENPSDEIAGFRPRAALIDLPQEAGLEAIRRLEHALSKRLGTQEVAQLVLAFDLLHTAKVGNNVRLLYSGRIEPQRDRDKKYERLRGALVNHSFRHQRLLNLMQARPWWYGFDSLLIDLPLEETLMSWRFAQDVKNSIEKIEQEEHAMTDSATVAEAPDAVYIEALILRIIESYIRRRMKDKYELDWKSVEGDERKRRDYTDKKDGLAKEAFFAVRSRTGEDFINYFASSICSVPHWMSQSEYLRMTNDLYKETEKVRTLTMLALSTRVSSKVESKETNES